MNKISISTNEREHTAYFDVISNLLFTRLPDGSVKRVKLSQLPPEQQAEALLADYVASIESPRC